MGIDPYFGRISDHAAIKENGPAGPFRL